MTQNANLNCVKNNNVEVKNITVVYKMFSFITL